MLFNSFEFIFIFLPIVLAVATRLRGNALLRWICLASIVFYAFAGHVWFIVPMLITTVLDFLVAQKIEGSSSAAIRKRWLLVSMLGNLGLLAYFKYSALFVHTAEAISNHPLPWASAFQVVLPAGISFYTFQTLSYIIDVYRHECRAEQNFARFTGFVSFFPHLVAGPLTRHDQLIPALSSIAKTGIRPRWGAGLTLFSVGLCKKVLFGDNLGHFVDGQLAHFEVLGFATGWLAIVGYALQIYFDFSGYSDMAIGLGRLFGIELPQNFNEPYRALNPSDFWRRWHITLSRWLRDYLYISLGGNRCSNTRRSFNLMATMVLGGLWHGANWTFAAWGFFHGLLLILYSEVQPQWDRASRQLQMAVTFFLVCIGWVFFRSNTFHDAALWLRGLFGFNGIGRFSSGTGLFVALLAAGFISIHGLRRWRNPDCDFGSLIQLGLGVATGLAVLFMSQSSRFLYFQF